MRYHSRKVLFFRSFFGRIEDTKKKTFRNQLTIKQCQKGWEIDSNLVASQYLNFKNLNDKIQMRISSIYKHAGLTALK